MPAAKRYYVEDIAAMPEYRKYSDMLYNALRPGVLYTLEQAQSALIVGMKGRSSAYMRRINSETHTRLGKFAIA